MGLFSKSTCKFCIYLLLTAWPAALLPQRQAPLFQVSATKYLLGTQVDIIALGQDIRAAKTACYFAFREMERIEALLSSHRPDSEISRINRQAAHRPVHVSQETFAILQRALEYSRRFGGLFDVTIGPLTTLWGFNEDRDIRVPDSTAVARLLPLVNFRNLQLDPADTSVRFARPGMRIDLGGIAKGYAIDRAAATLKAHGISRFLINAGGDIFASGRKAEGQKWRIGIKHPRRPGELLAAFELSDSAVATSGDYERFVILDGLRYHHILDPRTGYPARSDQSVTVIAATAEEADAAATALFIRGWQPPSSSNSFHALQALFLDAGGSLHIPSSWFTRYRLRRFE